MEIAHDLVKIILSLQDFFEDYELIHIYMGNHQVPDSIRSFEELKKQLQCMLLRVREEVPDEFPHYRATYFEDFITSIVCQIEYFLEKQYTDDMNAIIYALYALDENSIKPFDLSASYDACNMLLKNAHIHSFEEFHNKKTRQTFTRNELSKHIKKIASVLIRETYVRYNGYLHNLKEILPQNIYQQITVNFYKKGSPPCYYQYQGNYKGEIGLAIQDNFKDTYLFQFLCHECIPGHHLYYLLKERAVEVGGDDLFALDTFYSPENLINEGLATTTYLMLQDAVPPLIRIDMEIEKIFHRGIYNCWYDYYFQQKNNVENYIAFFADLGLPGDMTLPHINYFLHELPLYTPSYAKGQFLIEDFINQHGESSIKYCYNQHSPRSLRKVSERLRNGNL